MHITLIGTGRLGTHLATALRTAGHSVLWLAGRTLQPREVQGDVVIICVRDDAIPAVADRLRGRDDLLVVHTAGSVGMDALPMERRGVFYPMQTFSREREVDFTQVPLFTEAARKADAELLHQLGTSISHNVHPLDSEARRHLHLAAVFASNFTNHCYALAADILMAKGIPFAVLLPLIDETARKVHTLLPREAQTGPAVRYDEAVLARQEALLEGRTKEIYHLMSQSIHDKL